MKEPREATACRNYRRNSTFPSSIDTKVDRKHQTLFLVFINFDHQEADVDPESLLLPLSKRRKSRRLSTVDGLRPDGGGGGNIINDNDISLQETGVI